MRGSMMSFCFRTATLIASTVVAVSFTGVADAQSNRRPLSDFLSAQGSTTCFTPPAPAQLGGARLLRLAGRFLCAQNAVYAGLE